MPSEPSTSEGEQRERDRRRLEGVLPELIKRILDVGYDKLSEGPENVRNFVSELRLPKEVLNLLVTQIEETKHGLYRVVAKEIRSYLEQTNFAEEMAKVLSKMSLQVKTDVRFVPNDSTANPDLRSEVEVKGAPTTERGGAGGSGSGSGEQA